MTRTLTKLLVPLLLVAALIGCASQPPMPTLQGQAHAALLDAEHVVTQVAITLSEYRSAGVIVKGSAQDTKLRTLLSKAAAALDDGWAAYSVTQYTDAMAGAKSAKSMYFAIRKDLLKLGGAP